MDYHAIGFRECAAEVARYLVTVEGMDVQDPMRMRLMSHLQCFATQRELSNKPTAVAGAIPSAPTTNSGAGWPFPATHHTSYTATGSSSGHFNAPSGSGSHHQNAPNTPPVPMFDHQNPHLNYGMGDGLMGNNAAFHHAASNPAGRLVASSGSHAHSGVMSAASSMTALQPVAPSGHPAYPHVNHHPFPSLAAQNGGYPTSGNQVKPYRPWGAELAY